MQRVHFCTIVDSVERYSKHSPCVKAVAWSRQDYIGSSSPSYSMLVFGCYLGFCNACVTFFGWFARHSTSSYGCIIQASPSVSTLFFRLISSGTRLVIFRSLHILRRKNRRPMAARWLPRNHIEYAWVCHGCAGFWPIVNVSPRGYPWQSTDNPRVTIG